MLTARLYGECKRLGHCICSGDSGCGVEDDPTMYWCDECNKSHMMGHNPHEAKTSPAKREPYTPLLKRPTNGSVRLGDVMDSPGASVLAARAAVKKVPSVTTEVEGLVTPEVFVRAYMDAHKKGESLNDLALRLGMKHSSVLAKTGKFRGLGVKLPHLKTGREIDVERLNAIIESGD